MPIRLNNRRQLNAYISQQSQQIEAALVYYLEFLVTEMADHAKLNAAYTDQTSNLKSSIGGVVLRDGKPVTYRGFEGKAEGKTKGFQLINDLIGEHQNGYAIIIVAGMEYASYVENFHGLNVLKKTELKMRAELSSGLKKLKDKIDKL